MQHPITLFVTKGKALLLAPFAPWTNGGAWSLGRKALTSAPSPKHITYHTHIIYPTNPIYLYQTNQQKIMDRLTTSYQAVPSYARPTHANHYIPVQHMPTITYLSNTCQPLHTCPTHANHYIPVQHMPTITYPSNTCQPLHTRPTHAIHYIPAQHMPSIITTPGQHP